MRVADVLTWHNRQFHLAREVFGGWQASRHGGEAVQGSRGDNLFFLVASEAWWTGFTGDAADRAPSGSSRLGVACLRLALLATAGSW